MTECVHEKLPYMCHGTGDAFASAMIGGVMAGLDLAAASRLAGEFVHNAMHSDEVPARLSGSWREFRTEPGRFDQPRGLSRSWI